MFTGFFKNLLQILAFACFLSAGYLNLIKVPENHLGVLVETTGGIQKPLLPPGYHWNWTGFVPLKWEFYLINVNPPVTEVNFREPLHYSRFLEDPKSYDIHIDLNIKYHLSDKSVYYFWNYLNKKILENKMYIVERTKLLAELFLMDVYRKEEDIRKLNPLLRKYFEKNGKFQEDWNEIFKEEGIVLESYELKNLEIPEPAVYLDALKNMGPISEARREALSRKILAEADAYQRKLLNEVDLEKADNFIAIMKKYPDIIKYYQIEKINPKAKSVIMIDQNLNGRDAVEKEKNAAAKEVIKNKPQKPPEEETGQVGPIKKTEKKP